MTKAIVVGGGIGGLTTGVALRQAGVDTVVFERTPEYRELGTGLHIAINAMRGLRELGLADEVVRRAGTLVERYGGFAAPVPAIVEATPDEVIVGVDAKDRPPAERWGEGRVTLLGDAAHPMSPTQGQGACQAIEDAVVLGKSLRQHADVPTALRAYEQRRIPRTSKFVRQSRLIGSAGRWQNPIACALRDQLLRRGGRRAFARAAREMAYEF